MYNVRSKGPIELKIQHRTESWYNMSNFTKFGRIFINDCAHFSVFLAWILNVPIYHKSHTDIIFAIKFIDLRYQ